MPELLKLVAPIYEGEDGTLYRRIKNAKDALAAAAPVKHFVDRDGEPQPGWFVPLLASPAAKTTQEVGD